MTIFQYVCGAAALAVAAWPQIVSFVGRVLEPSDVQPEPQGGVSYQDAIENLAVVRVRLLKTELLGDEQKKAIDVLTLALVSGSDK